MPSLNFKLALWVDLLHRSIGALYLCQLLVCTVVVVAVAAATAAITAAIATPLKGENIQSIG